MGFRSRTFCRETVAFGKLMLETSHVRFLRRELGSMFLVYNFSNCAFDFLHGSVAFGFSVSAVKYRAQEVSHLSNGIVAHNMHRETTGLGCGEAFGLILFMRL